MADSTPTGRHRAPGRHNPLTELSVVASRAGSTSMKASAVLAASGGMVVALALPASAAQARPTPAGGSATVGAPAPFAVPAPFAPVDAPAAASAAAPAAVAAPVVTPARPATFGVVGVKATAKAKPKPKPKPAPVVVQATTVEATTAPSASGGQSSGTRSSDSTSRSRTRTPAASGSTTRSATKATKKTTKVKKAKKSKRSTTRSAPAPSASGVVGIARGLLGIPYRMGGTTTSGFDCSGFTSYVFRRAGVSLPRTAAAQQAAATRVSSPRPGDLVFFGSPAYHVGIYTGPGMMIDSPRSGKSTSERGIWSSNVSYGRF